jgi:uncharacterized protein YjbI with pentapeptide repeats
MDDEILRLEKVRRRIEARDCNLAGSSFTNINLSGARFHDVNLSGATIDDVNLSGWNVQDVNFSGLKITNADLSNAAIAHCLIEGMTIDGIKVTDLLAAYRTTRPV